MENRDTKQIIRIIFFVFVVIWMIIVFRFSNQPADLSQNTSLDMTEKIGKFLYGFNYEEEKELLIGKFDPIVRKLAHYTLYTIGGFLIINYINTYSIIKKKKVLYSIIIGTLYACTDEIHQLFVVGRSGQITDVLLDSLGIITGVCIFICIHNLVLKIRKKAWIIRYKYGII